MQSGPVSDGAIGDVLFFNATGHAVNVRRGDALMVAFVVQIERVGRPDSAQASEYFSAQDQGSDRDERYDENMYLYLPELQSESSNRVDLFA